jgi:hypothetical protein
MSIPDVTRLPVANSNSLAVEAFTPSFLEEVSSSVAFVEKVKAVSQPEIRANRSFRNVNWESDSSDDDMPELPPIDENVVSRRSPTPRSFDSPQSPPPPVNRSSPMRGSPMRRSPEPMAHSHPEWGFELRNFVKQGKTAIIRPEVGVIVGRSLLALTLSKKLPRENNRSISPLN